MKNTDKYIFKKNKKSQVFVVGTVVLIIFGLVAAFVSIHYLYSEKSKDETLGTYESAMIAALVDGDKALIYQEQAAKYAANKALRTFIDNGGMNIYADSGEDATGAKCGRYIYNLWDSETTNCFPTFKSSFSYYMSESLRDQLGIMHDPNFQKSVTMDYSFTPKMDKTRITAIAQDTYDFYLFKNMEYKADLNLQDYLSQINRYVGTFIWPLPNNYQVSSCFGYRGINYGTSYHGGLDIPANKGTLIIASAPGTISDIKFPDWGRVEINHGQGIKTEYLHMDTIDPAIKLGASVVQGQKIGTVGGRGKTRADEYKNHLHFSVIDDNVNARLAYNNIPAVIDGYWGKFVNPACFLSQDFLKQNNINLNFDSNSISCSKTCDTTGQTCINYPNVAQQAYKFCDLYKSIVSAKAGCQINDNHNWKVSNMKLSSNTLTADQTLTITMTIENEDAQCASIYGMPTITSSTASIQLNPYKPKSNNLVDIYTKSSTNPYTDTKDIICYFSTDATKAKVERDGGKCVLQAPADNSQITYTVQGSGIDTKGYSPSLETDYPLLQTITISSARSGMKPSDDLYAPSTAVTVQLSPQDQKTFDATKKKLSEGKFQDGTTWLSYIEQVASKNGIPKEIMLGKITQESAGINYDIKIPTNYAVGIVQVEGRSHYAQISDICGRQYTSECNGQYATCKYIQFHDDVKCQIDTAAFILKDYYNKYSKDSTYEAAVKSSCTNPSYQNVYLGYKSWERALRAYNGFGCTAATSQYVPLVMKWSNAWGYGNYADYVAISKDQIEKGIIGVYKTKPSFTTSVDFDSGLFDALVKYMTDATTNCKTTNDRNKCVDETIKKFNDEVSAKYVAQKRIVNLTRDCESSLNEKKIDTFIQSIDECKASVAYDCQCPINNSDVDIELHVDSNEQFTQFQFDKESLKIQSDARFYDDSNLLFIGKTVNIRDVHVYKEKNGFKFKTVSGAQCPIVPNRFKICLKTDYKTTTLVKDKIVSDDIILKFAITIRDALAPDIVKGIELRDNKHDVNSVIVSWTKNNETDIQGYFIYLGNSKTDFTNVDTSALKNKIPYRTLDVLKSGVAKYTSLNYDKEPTCIVTVENGVKFCTFKYDAVTSSYDGSKPTQIMLETNKLYYIESTNKYVYLINGTDTYNQMKSGVDKYIAITAYDTDGNELNNTAGGKLISQPNGNLKTIKPNNTLEPGFVNDIKYTPNPALLASRQIILSWDQVSSFIDGNPITAAAGITYNMTLIRSKCNDNDLLPNNVAVVTSQIYSVTSANTFSILTLIPSDYCLIVTSRQNGKEYRYGLAKSLKVI